MTSFRQIYSKLQDGETLDLSSVLDLDALQIMMEDLFQITKIGFSLIDLQGNVLVGVGWQDICMNFHRKNPQTLKHCLESDIELTKGVKEGEYKVYKCKNGLVDVVTPLYIGGNHVANIFSGQFLFKEVANPIERFGEQAERYGFDKEAYLSAFKRTPQWDRGHVEALMVFFTKLTNMLSKKGFANLRLIQKTELLELTQRKLEDNACTLEEYANQMDTLAKERLDQLKEQERLVAIGQTAGMVGHDIRNPLQAITSDLYLIQEELKNSKSDKEIILESVKGIEENIFYINKIVSDLLDYTRPFAPTIEQVNLRDLINSTLLVSNVPKNITTEVTVDRPLGITTDPAHLKRALTNLIINAVQAMPNGGKLSIIAHKEDLVTRITVCDTGVGIPEEAKPNLFKPLFTTKSKGQGLGLAVVKRIVEGLHGNITFESQEGNGTKFICELPNIDTYKV